jgi:adenosylcobyric acid synthase
VVLPGSRATMSDLAWLRERGLDTAIIRRAAEGKPVLGICGGNQMLAGTIHDPHGIESGGVVDGLGLLPTRVDFGIEKLLGRPVGDWRGHDVAAYEIHHGVTTLDGAALRAWEASMFLDGFTMGAVWGTTWHGAFESDGFRRAFLAEIASRTGSPWVPQPDAPSYAARREDMLDRLADALDEAVGFQPLLDLVDQGVR